MELSFHAAELLLVFELFFDFTDLSFLSSKFGLDEDISASPLLPKTISGFLKLYGSS